MSRTLTPGGVLLGAGLMYFWDPARGRKRRARIGEYLTHLRNVETRLFEKAFRDGAQRLHGLEERLRRRADVESSDGVLEGRVHAQLGHLVSNVGAVEVGVHAGVVVLRGAIPTQEAALAVRRIAQIPGVRDVIDGFEHLESPPPPPAHPPSTSWTPSLQATAMVTGAALAAWGFVARRGLTGAILGSAGGLLALRGGLNLPVSRIFEYVVGDRPVAIHKTIVVQAPIEHVFQLWSRFDQFPRFMQHVRSVHIDRDDDRQSRWTVDGPGGTPISFDAEVTSVEVNREIAWKTLPGQRLQHAGIVRFEPAADGTRIQVLMTYLPPGGIIAHAIAHALGWDPKARLDEDLLRLKALLELGRTRAHGGHVTLEQLERAPALERTSP